MTITTNAININNDGLAIFESSTGTFSAIELTTKGDILTRTTSVYTDLGVGTDTHVLISDSTQASGLNYAAKTSGSSVIYLETQTASASASVDFTASFDDLTYLYYIFTYTNVSPTTDGVELRVKMSVDTGSSWESSGYRWVRMRLSSSSGSDSISDSNSDSKIKIMTDLGNSSGEGLSGKAIYIPSPSPSSDYPGQLMHDNIFVKSTGTMYRNFGKGMLGTNSVVDGIQFYMSSGTVATGVFKMYGVTKV